MKRNTKWIKLASLFSLLIIILSILNGCKDKKNDIFIEKNINFEDFNSIGEEHNKGLDFAYTKLEETLNNLSNTKSGKDLNIYQIVKDATKQFMQNYELDADAKELVNSQIEKDFSKHQLTLKSDAGQINSIDEGIFSDNLKRLLSELGTLIHEVTPKKLEYTIENIEIIEDSGKNILDDAELAVLLSGSSIAKYSAEYWCENSKKWITLLGKLKTSQHTFDSTRSLKSVGVARTIYGHVTAAGMPIALPGANIWVEGTSYGTTANLDGYYTLDCVFDDDILRCSYAGFTTNRRPVGTDTNIDFYLSDEFSIYEVVEDDLYAGIATASSLWIVNYVPVAGQATFATITIAGALTGSLISIYDQIY